MGLDSQETSHVTPAHIFPYAGWILKPWWPCIQVCCSSSPPLFTSSLGPQSQRAPSSAFLYLASSHSGRCHLVPRAGSANCRDLALYSPYLQNASPQARQTVGTQSILADRSQEAGMIHNKLQASSGSFLD